MGDNAEMILDGILDQYTGEYIGEDVGYSISLKNSYSRFKRTKHKELQGLRKYTENFKWVKNIQHSNNLINEYASIKGYQGSLPEVSIEIQKDFKGFVKFMKKKH